MLEQLGEALLLNRSNGGGGVAELREVRHITLGVDGIGVALAPLLQALLQLQLTSPLRGRLQLDGLSGEGRIKVAQILVVRHARIVGRLYLLIKEGNSSNKKDKRKLKGFCQNFCFCSTFVYLLCENISPGDVLEEGMEHDLSGVRRSAAQSAAGIFLEEAPQQGTGLGADSGRESHLSNQDLLKEHVMLVGDERKATDEHLVHDHAEAPPVHLVVV